MVRKCEGGILLLIYREVEKATHPLVGGGFVSPLEQQSSSLAYAPEIVNAMRRLICAAARDGMSRERISLVRLDSL